MILEAKIKKAALSAAIDRSEKRMLKSPERYARNLVERVQSTYPGQLSSEQSEVLFKELVQLCREKEARKIRILINSIIEE